MSIEGRRRQLLYYEPYRFLIYYQMVELQQEIYNSLSRVKLNNISNESAKIMAVFNCAIMHDFMQMHNTFNT